MSTSCASPPAQLEETRSREGDRLRPARPHRGRPFGLAHRGARAVAESGGFRTFVLADRITRASCFVCRSAAEAIELSRWLEGELDAMRAWLEEQDDPSLSKFARLREVKTHVVGPMCHVLWRWTTGDAVGANMMTRNSYLLNMGYVMERAPVKPQRAILEANMGGDKKPSFEYFQGGHGKTVLAETTLTEDAVRRVLRTSLDDLPGAGLGGHARRGRLRHAVGGLHARLGDRRDLRRHGPGPRHGRDELDGARQRRGGSRAASTSRFGFPGLEVATVGGGTTLPYARSWLELLGCAGAGKVYRFAQIVAAATLGARDLGLRGDGDSRLGRVFPRAPRARRTSLDRVIERSGATADNEAKATYLRPDEVIEMLRIWLMAMLAAAVLGTVRDHDLLHRTGLIGYCTTTTAPHGAKGTWRACEKGAIDGRPNLTGNSCTRRGQSGKVEYWSCRTPVRSKALTANRSRQ